MGTYDQPGSFTKISIKNLQSPSIDPVKVLYDYLDCPVFSKPLVFLYYFFDKDGTLFDKDASGNYTKLGKRYLGVVNKILTRVLEKTGASMTEQQSRETYIIFSLCFNALSKEEYNELFPASHTGKQYRPGPCTCEKMDACLNAIGEESLNPVIPQEAVWMLGLELGFTPSICDDIMQKFTMEESPTAERGATTMLFREIEGIVNKLKNEPDEQKKQAGVIEFLKSRAKAFKGYSQTRQQVWNSLVKKYTGKEDLSINELYRLLNFRFLFFGKTDKRKTIDLAPRVKKVLLPPQYDRFWNIVGTARLSNTIFWTFISNNENVETAKKLLAERDREEEDRAVAEEDCAEPEKITKDEQKRIRTAKVAASCVSTMDEEFDPARIEKALAGENLTLEPRVKTLRQLAQRYANLDQPTRNMILTLSYAVALQDSQGADAETVRRRFADSANQYLGLAGYGRLNTKLPLDAALYSCIQDDDVISLDALYEQIITQKVTGTVGLRAVNFDLPAPAEIKRILWKKAQNHTSKSKQTTAVAPEVTAPTGVSGDAAAPVDTDIDPDTPKPIISQESMRNRGHDKLFREHDKLFTEQLQHQKYIDFMPKTDDGHIDPKGLCPGERSVPADARFVKIEVYPFYNASGTKRVKLNNSPEAQSFLEKRVEDRRHIVQLSAKLDEKKRLYAAATDLIDLEKVQIATPEQADSAQKQSSNNPLITYLEKAIPREHLGEDVPSGQKVTCQMVLKYYDKDRSLMEDKKVTLNQDYHEEYPRYARTYFYVVIKEHANVNERLKKDEDFPYDILHDHIYDALQKAAKNYDPERALFNTYFRDYVWGEISKFARDNWPEHKSLDELLDGTEDEDDRTRAMANKIQLEISTDSPENALLNFTNEMRDTLEDLYDKQKDNLLPVERNVLMLLYGLDQYDYTYALLEPDAPDSEAADRRADVLQATYLHFLGNKEDADEAMEWEEFLDKQFAGEALDFAAIDRVPTQKVQEYFELDKQAAAEKKRRANYIYKFLHRPLTPFDIYTVFKSIPALNNFYEVTKSDIQNFALFAYRKLLDAQ